MNNTTQVLDDTYSEPNMNYTNDFIEDEIIDEYCEQRHIRGLNHEQSLDRCRDIYAMSSDDMKVLRQLVGKGNYNHD